MHRGVEGSDKGICSGTIDPFFSATRVMPWLVFEFRRDEASLRESFSQMVIKRIVYVAFRKLLNTVRVVDGHFTFRNNSREVNLVHTSERVPTGNKT